MKHPLPVRRPFAFRLDMHSGVPLYRHLIDQVQAAIAAGLLVPGDQLPTVRQVAVDLEINPNTVMRAYREMEIRGILDTQQGTGTFVAQQTIDRDALAVRHGAPHPDNAPFTLDRFTTGALIDEHGAAAVAH